jgi:hypothetical protein
MREEEKLIEDAQRSRDETAKLRDGEEPSQDVDVPEHHDPEPWAKTSSGDKDSVTDDE